ncbi:hypothetical protein ACET3X_007831 [Alternaria dauci]|uniref:Carbohydrate-binding module family 18 protein n=1 Tax=Alternaria dauci TaxID=48095 RepID=A0ABR3UDI1_9PLEO
MRWDLLLPFAAAATLVAGKVSTNARCGNAYNALPGGMSCTGSKWGNCCSQYGYCGKTKDYCGTGCQSPFGTCNSVATPARTSTSSSHSSTSSTTVVSPVAPSSAAVKVTTNARCGNLYGASPAGMTCSGGKYGDCCSQYSYCGSSSAYCGTGCQPGFGKCDAVSSSSAVSSSTLSSSSLDSSSSSAAPVSSSSTTESTISTTSTSSEIAVTSTSSTTASPSPTAEEFCGVAGYDVVDLQVFSGKPFTSLDACLADCKANSQCRSYIIYSDTCYFARLPITSTNVVPSPNTGLTYYNRDCEANPMAATTAPPSTLATSTVPISTGMTSTSTSTVCVPPAPTVSCVPYPTCPKFTAGLANSCPCYGAQCQDDYFVRCGETPASGSQAISSIPGISVDACRQKCDEIDNCMAFSYKTSTCNLWKYVNGFISDPDSNDYIRICKVATCSSAPVRRGDESVSALLGVGKSVSIGLWNGSA